MLLVIFGPINPPSHQPQTAESPRLDRGVVSGAKPDMTRIYQEGSLSLGR